MCLVARRTCCPRGGFYAPLVVVPCRGVGAASPSPFHGSSLGWACCCPLLSPSWWSLCSVLWSFRWSGGSCCWSDCFVVALLVFDLLLVGVRLVLLSALCFAMLRVLWSLSPLGGPCGFAVWAGVPWSLCLSLPSFLSCVLLCFACVLLCFALVRGSLWRFCAFGFRPLLVRLG